MAKPDIQTLAELKKSGYKSRSIKEEIRENLIKSLKENNNYMPDVKGYEDTVIPQFESALLAQHNILLLGLRGQAKTRMARNIINLLDEYMPIVKGSPINDDPLMPISTFAKNLINEKGKDTPIEWVHRSERYSEKLATPDVSVADLIGDIDPIKAATQKLALDDPSVINYGMIPRANRSIFVINELPDLQSRIQVALFNILEEGDVQIRSFKLRFLLDIQFVFTANPEDYTSRGSIVTPLKDRIESQIITHYPKTIELAKEITNQEANISNFQKDNIHVPELVRDLIEQIAFEARESEYIDQKSGVSARMGISYLENIFSIAERRMLINGESSTVLRISDLFRAIHSITGKVELVYEGENEGAENVAYYLIGKALRAQFTSFFVKPDDKEKGEIYKEVVKWFQDGNSVDLLADASNEDFVSALKKIPGLFESVNSQMVDIKKVETGFWAEFMLFSLAEYSKIGKHKLERGYQFKDLLSEMIDLEGFNFEEEIE